MKRWVLLWLATLASSAMSQSQSPQAREFSGTTVDTTGRPMALVEVRVLGTSRRAVSDDRGEFTLGPAGQGAATIVARRPGFAPETLRVEPSQAGALRFRLHPVIVELGEIVVRDSARLPARFDDFEHRRARRTGGQFITREQIDKWNPRSTTDVLRRMQGFKIVDSMGVSVAVSTRGPKPKLPTMTNCVLRVGLNGFVSLGLNLNSIPPADIHGIEINTGPNMPPEFSGARRDTYCGLIMIWTR